MASVTEDNHGKSMATEVVVSAENPDDRQPPPQRSGRVEGAGFFTIYKKGQGYWTRMLTAGGAILLIVMSTAFIYRQLPIFFTSDAVGAEAAAAAQRTRTITIAICAVWAAGLSLLGWWLMNRPNNADFLIATDSEMKKVNWTSRRELIGSTKVVIFFMFMIAAVLFLLDMYFTRVFYLMGILVADSWLWETAGNIGKNYINDKAGAGLVKGLLDVVGFVLVFGSAAWAVYGTTRRR
jgi:preprotein translocase subunit SecE